MLRNFSITAAIVGAALLSAGPVQATDFHGNSAAIPHQNGAAAQNDVLEATFFRKRFGHRGHRFGKRHHRRGYSKRYRGRHFGHRGFDFRNGVRRKGHKRGRFRSRQHLRDWKGFGAKRFHFFFGK